MMKTSLYTLAAAVVVLFSQYAYSYDWSNNPGNGSHEAPYQISTAQQLRSLTNSSNSILLDKSFLLINDLYFTKSLDIRTIEDFSGCFDGNDHVIYCEDSEDYFYNKLFETIESGAVVKNLSIIGGAFRDWDSAILAGINYGIVENCSAIANVENNNNYLGGLVFYNYGLIKNCFVKGDLYGGKTSNGLGGMVCLNRGLIENCHSEVNIIASGSWAGGLVSSNKGTIRNSSSICTINLDISPSEVAGGGLVGYNGGGTIESCWSNCIINGDQTVGCLVGFNATGNNGGATSYGAISSCFSYGSVNGTISVGGLVGTNWVGCTITNCYSTAKVTGVDYYVGGLVGYSLGDIINSYSTGTVRGADSRIGGLVGWFPSGHGDVTSSFWDITTSGMSSSAGGRGRTTEQMQTGSTFVNAGWDFDAVWYMFDYPALQWTLSPLQARINAAVDGDVIVVEPGVYSGLLFFNGKNVTLISTVPTDPDVVAATVLDGSGLGSVVTFGGSEDEICVLEGFTITGGYSTAQGGGIKGNGCYATIRNCIIRDNVAYMRVGGGIKGVAGTIENCIIKNNSATSGGGLSKCHGAIRNCLIVDNEASIGGNALNNCDGVIENCTIVSGRTSAEMSDSLLRKCDGTILNSILICDDDVFEDCTSQIDHSCWPLAQGGDNIDAEPKFFDPVNGDYRLACDSPCIDNGSNSAVTVDFDLDGKDRILDGDRDCQAIVDMGAYEYILVNTAPVADAGDDLVVSADGGCGATVTLDGSQSSDADGDALSYAWYYGGELFAEGALVEAELGLGEYVFSLVVSDCIAESAADEVVVTVVDDTAPVLSVSVWPELLRPVNHKMVKIEPTVTAYDNCGGNVEVELVGITCNQDSEGDIETGEGGIYLRAERSGNDREGRVYTLVYKATDQAGNETFAEATVAVPHDMRK